MGGASAGKAGAEQKYKGIQNFGGYGVDALTTNPYNDRVERKAELAYKTIQDFKANPMDASKYNSNPDTNNGATRMYNALWTNKADNGPGVFAYFKGNDTYVDMTTGKTVDNNLMKQLTEVEGNRFRPGKGKIPTIFKYEDSFDETKLGSSTATGTDPVASTPGADGTAAETGTLLGDEANTELQRKRQMQQGQKATPGAGTIQKPTLLGS